MLRNYFVVAIRTLLRQKSYSAINLLGLSIGVACCTMIYLYIDYELRHDLFHEKGERIYRLLIDDEKEARTGTLLPGDLTPLVVGEVPGVTRAAAFIRSTAQVRWGESVLDEGIGLVSPEFLHVFSFPLIHGDADSALENRDGVVITSAAAYRLFAEFGPELAEAVGRTISVRGRDFVVTGIAQDLPAASSLRFDYLVSFEHRQGYFVDSNDVGETTIYVEVGEGSDVQGVESALTRLVRSQLVALVEKRIPASLPPEVAEMYRRYMAEHYSVERLEQYSMRLQPLAAMRFDRSVKSHYVTRGNATHCWVLSGMGLLVLLVACINFTTLSIGGSARRAQEVGIRKVVGARRKQLMEQFWGEGLLLVLGSAVVGMGLADLALPVFAGLVEQPLAMAQMAGWRGPALVLGMLLFAGVAAGCYPALVMSRPHPVAVLKGQGGRSRRSRFLQGMLVAQYGLAVGLIAGSVMMVQQWDFMRTKELGFDREHVIVVPVPGEDEARRLQDAAERQSAIVGTAASDRSFTSGSNAVGLQENEGGLGHVRVIRVDPDYLSTLGIELLAGRDFDAERAADVEMAAIVNERLVQAMGWSEPLGNVLPVGQVSDSVQPTVIGVVKDFHFDPLRRQIQPLFLTMNPNYHGLYHVFVRVEAGATERALSQLEEAWSSAIPEDPFQWSFLDANLEAQYRDEERWTRIVSIAAGFVVLIACLGMLGQVTLAVTRRTKEIGIRKVLGASAAQVVKLMSTESTALLGLASVVSWPLSYLALQRWLEHFAYRIEPEPWVFALATATVMMLALLVVVSQSAGAALRAPSDSLRYE